MPGYEDVGSVQRLVLFPQEKRGFVTGWGTKQGVPDTVTGATGCPVWRQL